MWPKDEEEFTVKDYQSMELENLVRNNKSQTIDGSLNPEYVDQMKQLYMYLDKYWEGQYSRYCVTQVVDSDGKPLKETETSFSIILKTSAWIPAVKHNYIVNPVGSLLKDEDIVLCEPSTLYLRAPSLESLLLDKVLYLDARPMSGSSFHEFLKINSSVSTETVKNYLLSWSCREKDEVAAIFCTSLSHMKSVYRYLDTNLRKKELQELLCENPVIFVPNRNTELPHGQGTEVIVAGNMLSKAEVWLMDKTCLFEKYRPLLEEYHVDIGQKRILAKYYSDCADIIELFKQEGKFDTQPKVEEYIELMSLLCTVQTPKDARALSDVLYIFTTLGQMLVTRPEGMPNEQTADLALSALRSTLKKKLQKQKVSYLVT